MVRQALRRGGLIACALAALAVSATTADAAEGLCARLTVPDELGLVCIPGEAGSGDQIVTVQPTGGTFAALSRLTVRKLDRGSDPLAWSEPDEWLRRQVVVDTSSIADGIDRLADDPDSPWGGATAMLLAENVRDALARMGRAALQACAEPRSQGAYREMACRFGAAPLALLLTMRLETRGDERWALSLRSANEQRQRHFEAIANSFSPP
jgi:hypothetical protein